MADTPARRYVYVPEDAMARMSEQSKPMAQLINTMDSDMMSVLNNANLSPYEKWLRYSQTLNRYLQYRDAAVRKPLMLDIVGSGSGEAASSTSEPLNLDFVIDSIPLNFRPKARLLLHRLLLEPDFSVVQPSGEVQLADNVLPRSNIVDLISDVVRKRKNFSPVGWQQFASYLRKINIPRDWIGNDERYLAVATPEPGTPATTSAQRLKLLQARRATIKATPVTRRSRSQAARTSYHTPPQAASALWKGYSSERNNGDNDDDSEEY
jgi:hypothetical protein